MADRLDVVGRLAEGRVAVEHTQRYVRACRALGYEHPDLTSHPSQVRDWYDTEDGLDLRALDGDCTQLRVAGTAAAEALGMQHAQLSALTDAWTGPGADSALRFLERHCDAARMVANELRAAAQRCESLRDNLWYLLDSKAATAIAIDDRTVPLRSAWLAASDTVTTGAGDRPTAEDVVHQQIKPYVDNDIRNDWLEAMRSTLAGVVTSYDMVTDRMAAAPAAQFESPGDLGPGCQPLPPGVTGPPVAAAPVAPASVSPGLAADPGPARNPSPPASPQSPIVPAATDLGSVLGDAAALPATGGNSGGLGGGLSGLGGLAGLANRIVDEMGGLLGSATDQLGDPTTLDDAPGTENPFDEDPSGEDDDAADDEADDDRDAEDQPDVDADEPKATEEPELAEAAAPANAPPAGPPPLADAQPPVQAPPAAPPDGGSVPQVNKPPPSPTTGSTPCEIAADALPQAGQ